MSVSSSVGQRFSQLIQALGMSKNAFAISLDKTATVIQHLVDERNKPGFDLMNKVVDVYPNVSIEWLLRGKGPMLLNSTPTPPIPEALVAPLPTAAAVAPAPVATPKAAPAIPNFPTPLFTVSAARQSAPAVPAPPAALPPAEPVVLATAPQEVVTVASPAASQPAPAPVVNAQAEPLPAVPPVQGPPAAAAPPAPDAAYLTAALHAQYLQHQLALAEQRNQHLLAQQHLMQQMLDLLKRPA